MRWDSSHNAAYSTGTIDGLKLACRADDKASCRRLQRKYGGCAYPFTITILPHLPSIIQIHAIETDDRDAEGELEEAEDDVGEV